MSLEQLQAFYDYVENETELYQLDYLGYPWYAAARDMLINNLSKSAPLPSNREITAQVDIDANERASLLQSQYDYVFIVKSKMRTNNPDHIENLYCEDIFDYLDRRGKSFLIFEQTGAGTPADLKYRQSRFGDRTLPYRPFRMMFGSTNKNAIDQHAETFRAQVDERFAAIPDNAPFKELRDQLRQKYRDAEGHLTHILFVQQLLPMLGCKALFGAMGSFMYAGFNNPFAVVHVGHGYHGRMFSHVPLHLPARRYFREHFGLDRFFGLIPSVWDETAQMCDYIVEPTNTLNYGMPDRRRYQERPETLAALRQMYQIGDNPVMVVATSGAADHERVSKLIADTQARFPNLVVLLRRHPGYDNLLNPENLYAGTKDASEPLLYNLLNIADIVVSSPSSVAVEASTFTDNVIIVQGEDYGSFSPFVLRAQFPFADIIHPRASEAFVDSVQRMLERGHTPKPYQQPIDVESQLDELFARIERSHP